MIKGRRAKLGKVFEMEKSSEVVVSDAEKFFGLTHTIYQVSRERERK
jgi:hypothetical protein